MEMKSILLTIAQLHKKQLLILEETLGKEETFYIAGVIQKTTTEAMIATRYFYRNIALIGLTVISQEGAI